MALLSQLPTTFLMAALYTNPNSQTFPWGITGTSGDVTRTAVLTELNSRTGEQAVIVSGIAAPGASSKVVTNKNQIH